MAELFLPALTVLDNNQAHGVATLDTLFLDFFRTVLCGPTLWCHFYSASTPNRRMCEPWRTQHNKPSPPKTGRWLHGDISSRLYFLDITSRCRKNGVCEWPHSQRYILLCCRVTNDVVRSVQYTLVYLKQVGSGPTYWGGLGKHHFIPTVVCHGEKKFPYGKHVFSGHTQVAPRV